MDLELGKTIAVDVAVIGAGTAGLAAYRAAAAVTPRVLLIEGGIHGTTCARVGCMPSKLLIAAAEVAHDARDGEGFGVRSAVTVDGEAVMGRVRRERDRFVGFVVSSVERIPVEHRLEGLARFVGPGQLDVHGTAVKARAVVVATGSSPFVPPMFEGLGDKLIVNDDVFAWKTLPESVAVFGAGVIGLELGQALHRLGVRVRVFGRGGRLGVLTDPVVHAAALSAFSAEFSIDVDAGVKSVTQVDGGVRVASSGLNGELRVEEFAYALVATGRRPNVVGLDVGRGGVQVDERGQVAVDRTTLRVGDTNVFMAGDVNPEVPLLHEAADEGAIAGANAARYPDVTPGARRSLLAIVFTDPELAVAGATFAQLSGGAGAANLAIGSVSFEDQGRSRVMRKNRGAARVYAERGTGRFLGSELAGPRAEHIAHLLAWSHQQKLTVEQMLAMPFYHPVVEEGLRTALRDVNAELARRAPAA